MLARMEPWKPPFDWEKAVERNFEALERIVVLLLGLAGIGTLQPVVETLPRGRYIRILSILRPAEYAARRLIAMAACKLGPVMGARQQGHAPRPKGGTSGARQRRAEGEELKGGTDNPTPEEKGGKAGDRHPISPLVGEMSRRDTRGSTPGRVASPRVLPSASPRTGCARQSRVGVRTADRDDLPPPPGSAAPSASHPVCFSDLPSSGRLKAPDSEPRSAADRAPSFALFDPWKRFGDPWLTEEEIAALADPAGDACLSFRHRLPPGEPVAATALCRRINALRHALEDLDAHALRLARWRARRHLDTARPRRWSPMRPGRPPGWKKKPKTDVEEVLKECHFLARDAWDTS